MEFGDDTRVRLLMAASGLLDTPPHATPPPGRVPVRAISLAVAATCNLGCTYCYASQGSFGGTAGPMSLDVAKQAIDGLLGGGEPRRRRAARLPRGEPLANRDVLYQATQYAHRQALLAGVRPSFSLTTNATLLTAADATFLDRIPVRGHHQHRRRGRRP